MQHFLTARVFNLSEHGDWVQFLAGTRDFFFSKTSRLAMGLTDSAVYLVPGILSPEVKWPWHEANHSPLSSAVCNENHWTETSGSTHPVTLRHIPEDLIVNCRQMWHWTDVLSLVSSSVIKDAVFWKLCLLLSSVINMTSLCRGY